MFNKILTKAKSHSSFLILLSSALSLFLISILLKKQLSMEEYGKLSLLLTFISLIYSFSLLGLEQVFLRLSSFEKNILKINRNIFKIFLFIFPISVLSFTILIKYYYPDISYVKVVLFVSISTLSMFGYNIYRIMKVFNISQVIANGWKILLLTIFIGTINFYLIYNTILYSMLLILIFVISYFIYKYKIELYNKKEGVRPLWFNFAFSIFLVSIINYSDRYLVEYYLGIEEFGMYFYYLTVILFPYMLFQNYFGFKELPEFKKNFTIIILKNKIKKVTIFSLLLTVILILFFTVINNIDYFKELKIENYILMSILMITGITKIVYSILSAAIGATANKTIMKKCNIYTSITIVILFLIFITISKVSIELIATLYLIIIILRTLIFYIGIKNNAQH